MKRIMPVICMILALLIAIVSMSTMSFSWFEPDVKEGIGLEFKDETKLRAQNCTIKTYEGTLGNKVVNYGGDPVSTADVTVSGTTVKYYKTVITNSSTDYDTVVSLFLSSFTPTGGNASIGVAYPTNSYRTFSSEQTDIHIIRNAYVPKFVSTDAKPGEIVVEWFVKCDAGSVTFNPSQVYLMYN